MNRKASASKLSRREKRQQSPRSPLKLRDLNASSSYSSSSSTVSTGTYISTEASRDCIRFSFSHHSSSASKNACNETKFNSNTPKSAPTVKHLRGKLIDRNVVKNNNLQNPEKPICKRVSRLKKNNPPLCYPRQSRRKPSSKCGQSDDISKLSSGLEVKLCDNVAKFTPLTKLARGSGLDGKTRYDRALKLGEENTNYSDARSPTPPVEASVSPEIQGGSTTITSATPTTCYGAGHVLSGLSDKRKCRPRGILTIGENGLFGSSKSKTKGFGNSNTAESVNGAPNNCRDSLFPSLTEASVCWLLSPCDEQGSQIQDDNDRKGLKLNLCEMSMPFKSIGCSSSLASSLGFSSELLKESNSTITTSNATTGTHSSGKNSGSFMHQDSISEFRGFLGPSFDHLVCSPSPSSPTLVPCCEIELSPEQGKYQYDHAGETAPCAEDSIGSGNVIQTPQSNPSSRSCGVSRLSGDEISRLWFECELDSLSEVIKGVSLSPDCQITVAGSPMTSFEFNPVIGPTSSIDFSLSRKAVDSQTNLGACESLRRSLPESEVSISCLEGLATHMFEMDELDCCRCFSDEEENANGCTLPSDSSLRPELRADDSKSIAANTNDSTRLVQHEDAINGKDKEISPSEESTPWMESTTNNGGSLLAQDGSGRVC